MQIRAGSVARIIVTGITHRPSGQDIAKNGCGKLFVSVEACPVEYDLTAIVDGTLRLGDRSHPLCTPDSRPTKLQALGFVRE
jgi:hypothetical protein